MNYTTKEAEAIKKKAAAVSRQFLIDRARRSYRWTVKR